MSEKSTCSGGSRWGGFRWSLCRPPTHAIVLPREQSSVLTSGGRRDPCTTRPRSQACACERTLGGGRGAPGPTSEVHPKQPALAPSGVGRVPMATCRAAPTLSWSPAQVCPRGTMTWPPLPHRPEAGVATTSPWSPPPPALSCPCLLPTPATGGGSVTGLSGAGWTGPGGVGASGEQGSPGCLPRGQNGGGSWARVRVRLLAGLSWGLDWEPGGRGPEARQGSGRGWGWRTGGCGPGMAWCGQDVVATATGLPTRDGSLFCGSPSLCPPGIHSSLGCPGHGQKHLSPATTVCLLWDPGRAGPRAPEAGCGGGEGEGCLSVKPCVSGKGAPTPVLEATGTLGRPAGRDSQC